MQMTDQTKIKILKVVAITNAGMVLAYAMVNKDLNKTLVHSTKHVVHLQQKLNDANTYINTIQRVLAPTGEQIRQINSEFDLLKWDRALA